MIHAQVVIVEERARELVRQHIVRGSHRARSTRVRWLNPRIQIENVASDRVNAVGRDYVSRERVTHPRSVGQLSCGGGIVDWIRAREIELATTHGQSRDAGEQLCD